MKPLLNKLQRLFILGKWHYLKEWLLRFASHNHRQKPVFYSIKRKKYWKYESKN